MKIEIGLSKLSINETLIVAPHVIADFVKVLGEPDEIEYYNDGAKTELRWHNKGINGTFSTDNDSLEEFSIKLMKSNESSLIENNGLFKSDLIIENQDYLTYF